MTNAETWIQKACDGAGLQVDLCYSIVCSHGHRIESVARIRGVGAPNGMLIINDDAKVSDHLACLTMAGYGFSVFDVCSDISSFDLESAKEMFRDWGWTEGK